MDTVIVIPAYKPDERLTDIARELCSRYSVFVVDDGSGREYDDVFQNTAEYATVLRYDINGGKGHALKFAFSKLEEVFPEARYVITADADGQHKVPDIERVAAALKETGGLVLGSRKFVGKVPARSMFGNTVTRAVFGFASGRRIHDTQTGLRGFCTEECLEAFKSLRGDRYEYEMTMLMWAAENNVGMTEVTIETVYEADNPTSHFKAISDSVKIYLIILRCSSVFKYLASSVLAFLCNYAVALVLENFVFKDLVFGVEVATTVAWVISSFLNFNVNRTFVFKSKGKYLLSCAEYYGLAVTVFLIKNFVFLELLVRVLRIPLWIAMPISEVVMYVSNYFIQKKLIFKKKAKK